MSMFTFELEDASSFRELSPEDMTVSIQIALESAEVVERVYAMGTAGRLAARHVLFRAFENAMHALHVGDSVAENVYAMESDLGLNFAMEGEDGILAKIWKAIKDAVKWLLEKVGLGSENAEKADEAMQERVDKGIEKIKRKFDAGGRMLHQRELTGFPQFGKGRIDAKRVLNYVRQDLGGSHKAVVELAEKLTKLVKESKDFVNSGDFVTRAQSNIDKSFKVGEELNKIIESSVPTVSDLSKLGKIEAVKTFSETLGNKFINANVRGFGPFVRNGHVLWLRHNDVTFKWSTRGFDDLTGDKEPSAIIEFGNSQDYAKDSIEILEAIGEEKASKEIAEAVDGLGKAVKDWFAAIEATVNKESDAAKKAVLKHAREVMSTVNANIHSINAVRTMSKNSGQALISILISDGDVATAEAAEGEKKATDDAKAAKKAAKETGKDTKPAEGDKGTTGA